MKYSVRWNESRGGTPLLSNGKKEMVFPSYEEAKAFFDSELKNTSYKKIDDLGTVGKEYEKFLSQLELIKFDPINPSISGKVELVGNYLVAGSSFGTGRPFTGRTHSVTVYLSQEAFEALKIQKNKSKYIDELIKRDSSPTV